MTLAARRTALVLGGAGFVGSNVSERFVERGYRVVVVDGLLEGTGGRRENLARIAGEIELVDAAVESVSILGELVASSDVIVDGLAWTSHLDALRDPLRDLRLNAASHLAVISQLRARRGAKVIFLGSRSQYGNPDAAVITEETPMIPTDIQGIHKVAAESYYRVYSRLDGFHVASLRFPNCFGEHQRLEGADIGLVGLFIRSLVEGREVEVFGEGRTRPLVYARDIAEMVVRLAEAPLEGFQAFNAAGTEVELEELVRLLVERVGGGSYRLRPIPDEIRAIDPGAARVDESRLRDLIGPLPATDLRDALAITVEYFKQGLA